MITPEKLEETFNLWIKMTGQTMDTDGFSSKNQDYDVYQSNEIIKGSFKLDPTLKLPLLLLDYYARKYIKSRECSLDSLVFNNAATLEKVNACINLVKSLQNDDLEDVQNELLKLFKKIQAEYQLPEESLKIFEDKHVLTFLYRDVLWSIENLRLFKFTLPESAECPTNSPKLVKSIHEFENPTLLVDFMSNSINCIVVGWFPNPKIGFEYSSFAFAFRRGREIIFLTDLKQWDHPLQESMTRRAHPDRHLDAKMGHGHFPYYTLQEIAAPKENNEIKDLVIPGSTNKNFPKTLAYLNQLDPLESYWIIFVAGMIRDKFYTKNAPVEQEATSGFKVNSQPLLPDSRKIADPPKNSIANPLEAVHEAVKTGACGSHPHDQYKWMEDRYKDKVRKDLLFLTQYSSDGLLAPGKETNLLLTDGKHKLLDNENQSIVLKAFNLGRIGTPEELHADRMFLARYNEAKMVEKAAYDEFNQTCTKIYEWYVNKVKENMPTLLKYVANLSMKVENGVITNTDKRINEPHTWEELISTGNIMSIYDDNAKVSGCYSAGAGTIRFSSGWMNGPKKGPLYLFKRKNETFDHYCYLTEAINPPIRITFSIETTNAISAMTGVTCEDLPEVLKHFRKHEHYVGNQLLERIDPMEWALENPWMDQINFDVIMWISRKAFNNLRKEHSLPPNRFWLEKKKEKAKK